MSFKEKSVEDETFSKMYYIVVVPVSARSDDLHNHFLHVFYVIFYFPPNAT